MFIVVFSTLVLILVTGLLVKVSREAKDTKETPVILYTAIRMFSISCPACNSTIRITTQEDDLRVVCPECSLPMSIMVRHKFDHLANKG